VVVAKALRLPKATEDAPARTTAEAGAAFLAAIGGGCDLSVAGDAWLSYEDRLHKKGLLATPDGSGLVRRGAPGPASKPTLVGPQVALLLRSGGTSLLAAR
jgi:porphobilinogen deaminase